MNNPFVIDVREVLRHPGAPEDTSTRGPSPVRVGGEMLGIEEGREIEVRATLVNLGDAVMVDATVHGGATGRCSRCLNELEDELSIAVHEVFGITEGFIGGDEAEDGEEPPMVEDDRVDITQGVVDEVGLTVPFSPVCPDFGRDCSDDTPAPDGISEEQEEAPDPRWAALAEKFGDGEPDGED